MRIFQRNSVASAQSRVERTCACSRNCDNRLTTTHNIQPREHKIFQFIKQKVTPTMRRAEQKLRKKKQPDEWPSTQHTNTLRQGPRLLKTCPLEPTLILFTKRESGATDRCFLPTRGKPLRKSRARYVGVRDCSRRRFQA